MAESPPNFPDAYDSRCRALACRAALDRPALDEMWRTGNEVDADTVENLLVHISVDAQWACMLAGKTPKPLPVRSGPSSNGKAPSPHTRR